MLVDRITQFCYVTLLSERSQAFINVTFWWMQAEVDIRNAQIQHQAIEIQEKGDEIYRLQRELRVCAITFSLHNYNNEVFPHMYM